MPALVSCRLRTLPLWLAALLPMTGCAGVHSRQWGYPNGFARRAETGKGWGRSGKARAPLVKLRVEDIPGPESSGTALAPLD